MDICDFRRSFVLWRIDLEKKQPTTVTHKPPFTMNTARIPLECLCHISDIQTNKATQYILSAPCKTEHVNVTKDIWTQPNADFCMAASKDICLLMKSWDKNDKGVMRYPECLGPQPERQVEETADAFALFDIDVKLTQGRVLESVKEIIDAVLGKRPLVSRTEFGEGDGYRVVLEYPIKTINVSERDVYYQVDTGPVLLPDPTGSYNDIIEGFRLAYVAHNAPDWAEFIVNVPTPIAEGISVNHYSKAKRIDTKNTIIELL